MFAGKKVFFFNRVLKTNVFLSIDIIVVLHACLFE